MCFESIGIKPIVGKFPVINDENMKCPEYEERMNLEEWMVLVGTWSEKVSKRYIEDEKNAKSGILPWFGPGYRY